MQVICYDDGLSELLVLPPACPLQGKETVMRTDLVRGTIVEGRIPEHLPFEEQVQQALDLLKVAELQVRQNERICADRLQWKSVKLPRKVLICH